MKLKKAYSNQEVMKLKKNQSTVVTHISDNEITLTCPMNFKRFPFDEQYCDLHIFELHMPPSKKFNITTQKMKLGSNFRDFLPTVRDYEYTLLPAATSEFTMKAPGRPGFQVASAGFRLKLARISSKYYVMYYIPTCKYGS